MLVPTRIPHHSLARIPHFDLLFLDRIHKIRRGAGAPGAYNLMRKRNFYFSNFRPPTCERILI